MATTKSWSEIRAQQAQRPDDAERQAAARVRLEQQDRAYFARLADLRKAMGGRLEVHAVFPDDDVEIRFEDFERIDHDNPELGEVEAADAVGGVFGGTGG